ncbi:unnamed protein product [Owenia fusiformis]|uniref:Uncharacterized protein n=1 Tax=Owenia fusiformis TaxID=6347 RepID=A0A8J1UY50_OWEFU|nr:unnamed protein product [Owenia fusiformis]
MHFKTCFKRRTNATTIVILVLGLFVILLFTLNKDVDTIQDDVINVKINDNISIDSYTIRKMANTIEYSPTQDYTFHNTTTKQENTVSTQIKALMNLKQLIERNKKIYIYDLKEKLLNNNFEEKLKRTFQKGTYGKCSSVISEIRLRHDVQYFVFRYSYEPSPIDVTLLSHLTLNRGIHRISKILAQWPGPASLSVFGTDAEIKQFLDVNHPWERENVAIHAVYQRNATHYPVNFMRNVALYGANTSHIWMIDADFTPNKDAYQLIKKYIPQFDWTRNRPALVTPAFETNLNEGGVPDNRTHLLEKLNEKNKTIETFSFSRCRNCHKNTNWKHFMTTTKAYKIRGGGRFEPYVVLQRKTIPVYDERLIARHWNKILYDYELYALQYEFHVLPDVFIVHEPHERIIQPRVEFTCLDKIGLLIKQELLKKKKFLSKVMAEDKKKSDKPSL